MSYETIQIHRDGVIGTVTLDRPEVLNAISQELSRELGEAVQDFDDDPEIGVIIVTGSGEAFSSGADLGETVQSGKRAGEDEAESVWRIANCSKPTIGAINGLAYGSGAALATGFDIRVGCEKTSFKFGSASGRINSTWSLPSQVGWPTAKELLLTARVVDAKEAFRIGLLNHLVACDQLMLKAMQIARQIEANDPKSVMRIKELLGKGLGRSIQEMYDEERDAK